MIKWFLIGCGILAVILLPIWIWNHLPDRVQDFLDMVFFYAMLAGLLGFFGWLLYSILSGGGT